LVGLWWKAGRSVENIAAKRTGRGRSSIGKTRKIGSGIAKGGEKWSCGGGEKEEGPNEKNKKTTRTKQKNGSKKKEWGRWKKGPFPQVGSGPPSHFRLGEQMSSSKNTETGGDGARIPRAGWCNCLGTGRDREKTKIQNREKMFTIAQRQKGRYLRRG